MVAYAATSLAQSGQHAVRSPTVFYAPQRMTLKEFTTQGAKKFDPEFLAAIQAGIEASVKITEVRDKDGKLTHEVAYFGSGIVAANRCYVFTSYHVISAFKDDPLRRGKKWPDETVSPKGFRVKMIRVSGAGNRELFGKVVATGSSLSVSTDVALIRLDGPVPLSKLQTFKANPDQDVAALGFPGDLNASGDDILTIEKCQSVPGSSHPGEVQTTCTTIGGLSGGAGVGRRTDPTTGKAEYGYIGLWSGNGSARVIRPDGLMSTVDGMVASAPTSRWKHLSQHMQDELKSHPCH